MITVSQKVKDAFKDTSREIKGKVSHYRGDTETLINTFTHDNQVKSIKIDRVSDSNKFFGFGVSQKATIELLDKDNQIDINKGDILQVIFMIKATDITYTHSNIYPYFYVEDIQKDENTGNITVTAYDILYKLTKHTVSEIVLDAPYTAYDYWEAIADFVGLTKKIKFVVGVKRDEEYPDGGNFAGTETLREALNAIAEYLGCIYYVTQTELVFKQVTYSGAFYSVLTIDKSDYFTLQDSKPIKLTGVASVTDLGDNVEASNGGDGVTQYMYNNPFITLRDDIGDLMLGIFNCLENVTYVPYTLTWRGNYLVEIGDKITIVTKDGSTITTYLINETTTYDGGLKSVYNWSYDDTEKAHTNPTTIGEALSQTIARVDKANREIEMVVSQTEANTSNISSLFITTDEINGSVTSITKTLDESANEIETLKKSVELKMSDEDFNIKISKEMEKGAKKVVTDTGFSFDADGLTVSKSDSEMSTTITEDGMRVYRGNTAVLTANNTGVDATNLHATTYLIIGTNSRFEDYGRNRTGCFWIGG
jgi:hypothetical protein